MRLKRTEVKIEVGNDIFRYTYSTKHKEFTYEVKEGNWWRFLNYYTELSQLPKQVQDLFTK